MTPNTWTDGDKPQNIGIYATIYSWDSAEGSFPNCDTWDGEKWASRLPNYRYAGPFNTPQEAWVWAYAHDPEV